MVNFNGLDINPQVALLVLVALVVILSPLIDAILEWVGGKIFKR